MSLDKATRATSRNVTHKGVQLYDKLEAVDSSISSLTYSADTSLVDLYRYKVERVLPAIPPLVASIVASNGYQYIFPQAFTYGEGGDVYLNMTADTGLATWVVKYNSAGEAVSAFNAFAGVSELSHFYKSGNNSYYVTGGKGIVTVFDITNLPAGVSTQTPMTTYNTDVNFMGCSYGEGKFLLEEQAAPLSTVINRDRFYVFNTVTNSREQSVTLPLQLAGAQGGTPYSSVLHKTQGIAQSPQGLYLSHGKNSTPTAVDYQYATGISLANLLGGVDRTALLSPKVFAEFLTANGMNPTRIENEGITIKDGYPHVLHAYLTKSDAGVGSGGFVICSVGKPDGSTDLSHGAVSPLAANGYGRSDGNLLHNPYTGAVMSSMSDILDYMQATNTVEYSFYTSGATVTDLDGAVFATGSLVKIYNYNNFTFFYEVINTKTRTLWYSLIPYSKNYADWSGIGSAGNITNCITGDASGKGVTGDGNALYGHLSGAQLTTGVGNSNFGQGSGRGATTATGQSGLGRNAGWKQIDGSDNNFNLTTCIGQDSRVTGASQVQLGGAGTTPYAYNALQLRSDARDKIDVVDTELGLDFIMGLRAVQGRWDLRDSYLEQTKDADGNDTFVMLQKDGSRAGTRMHNWFIAQEVAELCIELGVDFAGLQHHKFNGGSDVYSLGYEEFIPPIVKALQQIREEQLAINSRLSVLEERLK